MKKLRVTPGAALLPAAICVSGAWEFAALIAVAVLVHELGHYAALRLCGGEAGLVRVGFPGVTMEYGGLSYGGEAITAMAGPGASLALASAAALAGRMFGLDALYRLAGLSLIFAVFNLLPIYPLDGGRALFCAVAYIFGLSAAENTRSALSAALTAALLFAGALLTRASGNPTLLIAALWLASDALRRRANSRRAQKDMYLHSPPRVIYLRVP
ncbi:MAG: site-2 protease family protein [Oscillospiraceae bacterium]|jgi:stage IV sporulation protein FB|nr:site-2 protease family protein [Oscillospiraceae bacterium]